MEDKHHFKIYRYTPKEMIFDGEMSSSEARRFMDQNASFERRVSFEVFNKGLSRWECFRDMSYHGGRKMYIQGELHILDPNYKGMKKPESQRFHLWCDTPGGRRLFLQSFATEEQAEKRRDFLQAVVEEGRYFVKPSDIGDEE